MQGGVAQAVPPSFFRNRACAELKDLMAKRDAMRKDELWDAAVKSGRSYEEIIAWLKSGE